MIFDTTNHPDLMTLDPIPPLSHVSQSSPAGGKPPATRVEEPDSAILSQAAHFRRLVDAQKGASEVRPEKVDEARKLVADPGYPPDTVIDQLANKLLPGLLNDVDSDRTDR